MSLLEKYKSFIKKENLFQPKDKLLLAVSGGVDSVVLCELTKQAGYDFVIAHCNFKLRGVDSDRDEEFVKGLGKKYGVAVFLKSFDTGVIAKKEKKSIEEMARELRYGWFNELIGNGQLAMGNEQLAMGNGQLAMGNEQSAKGNEPVDSDCRLPIANCILTGHHADDNIETVMMNFFRGTGIKGLRGILPKQGKLIRPLLFARRDELEKFARDNDLAFVVDQTNAENEYTRNYFRNEIIPMVSSKFPEARENLLKNIQRLGEANILYEQAIEWHKKRLLETKGNEVHIPVLKLMKTEPVATIVYEIIREFGFTAHQTDEVIALMQSESGKYVQSPSHRIIKNRKWLIISPNQSGEAELILIEEGMDNGQWAIGNGKQAIGNRQWATGNGQWATGNVQYAMGNLQIKKLPATNYQLPTCLPDRQANNFTASLDASHVKFPLLLRPWKKGDYFYPLGMKKKKKLSRFFIDKKLSLTEKEKVWVIESEKKIVWVVGMRIDERFKVTERTEIVLEFRIEN